MKVCTQSLKNATEQHEYKLVEMLRLNLNAQFIPLMSINPLTTAHCDKNEHFTNVSCANNGNSCLQCRKDPRQVKSCRTRHASREN